MANNFVLVEHSKTGNLADVPERSVDGWKDKGWKPKSEPRSYTQASREAADREAEKSSTTAAGKTGQKKES